VRSYERGMVALTRAGGAVANVASALYTDHLLAFEVSGILLLAGIVGAVALAKRELD